MIDLTVHSNTLVERIFVFFCTGVSFDKLCRPFEPGNLFGKSGCWNCPIHLIAWEYDVIDLGRAINPMISTSRFWSFMLKGEVLGYEEIGRKDIWFFKMAAQTV